MGIFSVNGIYKRFWLLAGRFSYLRIEKPKWLAGNVI